jgi:AbrB family looped-hinge helix DNA binding protein
MSVLEVTSLSSRGQIVIPNSIREGMHLETGAKLLVIQDGNNILLKPIQDPKSGEFKTLIALGDKIRKELKLKRSDVDTVIKQVRKAKRANHS